MSDEPNPYQEGKRAGVHPLIVVFVVLIGLWLFVFLIVPGSKNKQATGTEGPAGPITEDLDAAPVLFKVQAVVADMGARPVARDHAGADQGGRIAPRLRRQERRPGDRALQAEFRLGRRAR